MGIRDGLPLAAKDLISQRSISGCPESESLENYFKLIGHGNLEDWTPIMQV